MFDQLLSVIAPHSCLGCNAEGSLLCAVCRENLPLVAERCYRCHALSPGGHTCPSCRRHSTLHSVVAATKYDETAKALIWKLKFAHAPAAARNVVDVMVDRLVFADAVLVHVPTATGRVRQRGFDHAYQITRLIAARTSLPHRTYLRRIGQARQVGSSKQARADHMEHGYYAVSPRLIQDAHIILVDDVVTSGATLEAAARTLKAAGAKRVDAVVFAHA